MAPEGSGQDRFYVMALEDINTGTQYCWYDAAADDGGKLDNIVESSENDFGQGKTNTADVMEKWKTEKWGAQDDNGSNLDMWGEIEEEVSAGWFVPSKSEWSAFGDFTADLGITSDYGDYGLNHRYWSSSQSGSRSAYYADYYYGGFILDDYPTVTFSYPVRLSTTF